MILFVPKTKKFDAIKEGELIAIFLKDECIGYCVVFSKLNQIVLLKFDEEMSKVLTERFGSNIPFNFEIRGG